MKKLLFSASLLLSACLFQGCETDDGGRMRMGIQDPIERHKKRSWKWPFQREEKVRPAKYRPPTENSTLPEYQPMEYQTLDVVEPG